MIYEGKVMLAAEPRVVWHVVLDIDQFAACMPGVENLTRVDEQTFDGVMKARIGPIAGEFGFRARIVQSNPPTHVTVQVEGTDSLTKSTITTEVAMTLAAVNADETELGYRAVVDVQGRLAIIGDMVLRVTGAQVIEEFFNRLRGRVEGAPV